MTVRLTRAVGFLLAAIAVARAWASPLFIARHAVAGGEMLWSVTGGPAGLVAVGGGGTILTSANGTGWTRVASGTSDWLVAVIYGHNQYIAVGDHGTILVSTDATHWQRVSSSTSARLNNVIYAGSRYVAVGEEGTILTSPDGQEWTSRVSGTTGWLRGLAYGDPTYTAVTGSNALGPVIVSVHNPVYYACGANGVWVSSPDGIAWKTSVLFGTEDWEAMAQIGYSDASTFTAIGTGGVLGNFVYATFMAKSGGGYLLTHSWTSSVPTNVRLRGITQGIQALFVTGENGTVLARNYNGWTSLDSGTTANLVGAAYVGNSLFAVGENETILQSIPLYRSHFLNVSALGQANSAGTSFTAGFVVTGEAPKRMLLRAVGPGLGNFGVATPLATPVMTVFDANRRVMASNAGWATSSDAGAIIAAGEGVGAFPLAPASNDCATIVTLPPGAYSVGVAGTGGAAGTVLLEAYDLDPGANDSRAVNVSALGAIDANNQPLIVGFSVGGTSSRRVLVRAVGSTLRQFGVTTPAGNPRISIYRYGMSGSMATGSAPWSNQANADEVRGSALMCGAFPLQEDGSDAAVVIELGPGNFTAVVTGGAPGTALVEVYDLP